MSEVPPEIEDLELPPEGSEDPRTEKRNRENLPPPDGWLDLLWRLWAFRHWAVDRYTFEAFTRSLIAIGVVGSFLYIAVHTLTRNAEIAADSMILGSMISLASSVATHYFKSTD